jgi:hypothetical protein
MRLLVQLSAVVAALTLAPAALAKPWVPPPAAGDSGGRGGGSSFSTPRPPEAPVQFVLQAGYDIGAKKLVEAELSDGSTPSIRANQGLNLAVGLATLKLAGGLLATQATLGIERWSISASDGSIVWQTFPLEVLEFVYLDPIRVGAGLSYLLSPALDGDGVVDGFDVPFENSLGYVLEADWVARTSGSRGGRVTFGMRYVIQELKPKNRALRAVDANSVGFVIGATL